MKIKMDKSLARSRVEQDYELIENEGLFEEYLEMGLYPLFYSCHFSKFAYSGGNMGFFFNIQSNVLMVKFLCLRKAFLSGTQNKYVEFHL